METIEEIKAFNRIGEITGSSLEDVEDMAEAQRVVERYYRRKEFSELSMKVVVCGFFIGMIIGTWISPWDWVHWLARVILTVVYIAIICAIRSLDKAPEYPGHIPTNREEEMIDKEVGKLLEDAAEREFDKVFKVNFDSPSAWLEHEKWMRGQS